jgi:hypothetical protein
MCSELDSRQVQIITGHVIYNSTYKYRPDENCPSQSFGNTFFFRTNNRVKNLVKTFQCVMCATAYLPTHSLKSPAFLVPATLDDEGKNANFPSTPPHCRRRHRRRTAAAATVAGATVGLSMSVAENLLDTEHTLNPSSHLGFLLSCLSVCLSV